MLLIVKWSLFSCLQVDAGGILYIENKGIESYADPKNPPLRTGRVSVRTPTGSSRAGDLVGKVVRAVREAGPGGASLKDITAQLGAGAGVVSPGLGVTHEDSQLPAQIRNATRRALQRGFLAQSGKVFTLGTLAKHRKASGRPPTLKKHHGCIEDDDDDDLCLQLHNRSLDVNNSHLQVSQRIYCYEFFFHRCPVCGMLLPFTDVASSWFHLFNFSTHIYDSTYFLESPPLIHSYCIFSVSLYRRDTTCKRDTL